MIPEIEISIRYKGEPSDTLLTANNSKATAEIMRKLFDPGHILWTEEFIMLSLNAASKVIGYYKVSRGGMNSTVADIRVIAQVALQSMATSVIIAHNHPSGSTKPSEADKAITGKIKRGLATLDITLLDHLIITTDSFYSLADEGDLCFV